jgi:hypothetical protein
LDLNSAYHQIGLSKRSKPLTAFATDWNLYEYTRVPFGIATGVQVLTRLLDMVFSDVKFKFVFHYLDDLVIYSKSFDDHIALLREVFGRLRRAGLTVNPAKVKFATSHLSFLGHIISTNGVMIDPDRMRNITKFPPPHDVKGIARFVGMVNFFGKFIPHLAERAGPLNALRKKNVKFVWGPEQQRMPDFSRHFILQTDASSSAVAAVLLQDFDGFRQPIGYASHTLTSPEKNFSAYELECLAVLFGLKKFRAYVEHVEFDLKTDNQALMWCLSHPRQLGRIVQWIVRISSFKFVVHHIRGTQNVIADTLSRMYEGIEPLPVSPILLEFPMLYDDIGTHQRSDPALSSVIDRLSSGEDIPGYSLAKGILRCKACFDHRPKIVSPQSLIPSFFAFFHVSPAGGHLGIRKTLYKIRQTSIWKGMDSDVATRVKACKICVINLYEFKFMSMIWSLLSGSVCGLSIVPTAAGYCVA